MTAHPCEKAMMREEIIVESWTLDNSIQEKSGNGDPHTQKTFIKQKRF